MKKFLVILIVAFGVINQINCIISKTKSKEKLNDYDVKKKVILTPVSRIFNLFIVKSIVFRMHQNQLDHIIKLFK